MTKSPIISQKHCYIYYDCETDILFKKNLGKIKCVISVICLNAGSETYRPLVVMLNDIAMQQ